jgi:hypothetical protein
VPEEKKPLRIDFIQEVVSFDAKTGKLVGRLIPNPERYDFKIVDGREGYYDKFDGIFISLEELKKLASSLQGMPIHASPPKIESADEYVAERIPPIQRFF